MKQCDDTCSHSKSFEPEDCMRTFSQSESARLLSILQVYKVPSISQQHRHGSHRTQVHTNQHPDPTSVSRRVPRCPIPSKHISHGSCHKTRFPTTLHPALTHGRDVSTGVVENSWKIRRTQSGVIQLFVCSFSMTYHGCLRPAAHPKPVLWVACLSTI